MVKSIIILALAGFAAAGGFSFNKQKGLSVTSPAINFAADCASMEQSCDDSCIDSTATCCKEGDGEFCTKGYKCYDQGCCRDGETCSGSSGDCASGSKLCGKTCMPDDGICCDDDDNEDLWCASGEKCTSQGRCDRDSEDDDDDDDDDKSTLCTRRKRKTHSSGSGSGSKGGSSDDDGCGEEDEDDDEEDAGNFVTPSLLVGLVAVLPLVL